MNISDDSRSKPYDQISCWPDKTDDPGQLVYEISLPAIPINMWKSFCPLLLTDNDWLLLRQSFYCRLGLIHW